MFAAARKIPVAVNISGIWIVIAEYSVVDPAHPYISLIRFPVFHFFRSGDHSAQRLCAAVGDPGVFRSGVRRGYILTVHAGSHHNFVSRFCRLRCVIDVSERHFFCAVPVAGGFCINIDDHMRVLLVSVSAFVA